MAKRDKAKKNRASEIGGCTNTGGSIRHCNYIKKLQEEYGRDPTKAEVFRCTHLKRSTQEFVDHRASTTYDDYIKLKEAQSSQASTTGESPIELLDDDSLFFKATKGINKKGRAYGYGDDVRRLRFSSSQSTSFGSGPKYSQQEIEERVARMNSELHDQLTEEITTLCRDEGEGRGEEEEEDD
ncbi:uncharacterized protein LOC120014191 [Tripterygium wilfordii]|uniref:uncharacterized protein LOC120014191 n=1 Tax=Tripterygium wilfordii TaxID=458696 RepID=UPI0018F85255|nr:uncharacterized protein LOC120014191 [Tripterygium wilfordii]